MPMQKCACLKGGFSKWLHYLKDERLRHQGTGMARLRQPPNGARQTIPIREAIDRGFGDFLEKNAEEA